MGKDKGHHRTKHAVACVQILLLSYALSLTLTDFTPDQGDSFKSKTTLDLDLRERTPGSKLHDFRGKIVSQLEENRGTFFRYFLQKRKDFRDGWKGMGQEMRELEENNRILHVLIKVVGEEISYPDEGHFTRGVHIETPELKDIRSEEKGEGLFRIPSWKKLMEKNGDDIGIGFDFRVYCPEIVVQFVVFMKFELPRGTNRIQSGASHHITNFKALPPVRSLFKFCPPCL